MKRMIVGHVPTRWSHSYWNGRLARFTGNVTAHRAIYRDCPSKLDLLLEQNREHNREVETSFHIETSMSVGRYNPLTKQL